MMGSVPSVLDSSSPFSPRRAARASSLLRVLVVDDYRDAAESLAMLLQMCGHEVRVAHSAAEALSRAAEFGPDAVVSDLMLPGMDGYELAQELRRQTGLEKTLLVALSGLGDAQAQARSRQAGFALHLLKPLMEPNTLLTLLASLAEQKRKPHESSP